MSCPLRPESRLTHDVVDMRKARGQLALIFHQARAVFDHFAHGADVKVRQFFLFAAIADELRHFLLILRRPGHLHGKIGAHLEQLLELLVVLIQQIVRRWVANQDDLDIERNRFRRQAGCGQNSHLLPHLFDTDALIAQRLLERFPGQRLAQQAARVQDQVAAIGAMQCASFDLAEIGDQRAILRAHFHTTDQVEIRWIGLQNHGRALQPAVIHDHIQAIAVIRRARGRTKPQRRRLIHGALAFALLLARILFFGLSSPQIIRVFTDVGVYALQELDNFRPICVGLHDLVEERPGCDRRDLAIKIGQAHLGLFVDLLHLTHRAFQRLLQHRLARLEDLLLFFRQGLILFLSHRLAVFERRHHQPHRQAHQDKALLTRKLIELAQMVRAQLI